MDVSEDTLRNLVADYVETLLAPVEEKLTTERVTELVNSAWGWAMEHGFGAIWLGQHNRKMCDMPHNPHLVKGSYKTCSNCRNPPRDYCTTHSPLDKCVVCGANI